MARIRGGGRFWSPNSSRRGGGRRLLLCCRQQALNSIMLKSAPSNHPRPCRAAAARLGTVLFAVAVLTGSLSAPPAHAEGLEGRFDVRSADLEIKDGVYHLNARLDLPVSDAVRRGLAEGVPLAVELDIDIERVRQLLPNSRVARSDARSGGEE